MFYFAHVLQQAQARDTALMNETLPSDTELNHTLTDDSAPIEVVSLDQLELVNIETTSSHTVMTSLVSVDNDYQAVGVEGKDAIDISSEGPSPLLLIDGIQLANDSIINSLPGTVISIVREENDDLQNENPLLFSHDKQETNYPEEVNAINYNALFLSEDLF